MEPATGMDLIRLYHGLKSLYPYSDDVSRRRIREVREYHRGGDDAKRLQRVLSRKSDSMNETERKTLQAFPEHGLNIGRWSSSLIYSPAFRHMPKKEHSAIVSLIRLGHLRVIEGITQEGDRIELIINPRKGL